MTWSWPFQLFCTPSQCPLVIEYWAAISSVRAAAEHEAHDLKTP